ncbi:uncharacterized protein LOC127838919 [Dreissena polymorpha]|nr:uncharacterized protein LOC127838919 [Dreissena polymorpha]
MTTDVGKTTPTDEGHNTMKDQLNELRNTWLMIFAVSNTIWLALIFTLANKGQLFSVFGSNPAGLFVLVLFSLVVAIQFLAMLVHRLVTFTHFLARAPYSFKERKDDNSNQARNASVPKVVNEASARDKPNDDKNVKPAQNYKKNAIKQAWHTLVQFVCSVEKGTNTEETKPIVKGENESP